MKWFPNIYRTFLEFFFTEKHFYLELIKVTSFFFVKFVKFIQKCQFFKESVNSVLLIDR